MSNACTPLVLTFELSYS